MVLCFILQVLSVLIEQLFELVPVSTLLAPKAIEEAIIFLDAKRELVCLLIIVRLGADWAVSSLVMRTFDFIF